MKACLFVPGLFGSQLDAVTPLGQVKVWVNPITLASGWIVFLRLAPDGVSPPAEGAPQIVPVRALSPYYDQVQGPFRRQLEAAGYELLVVPMDFRQSIFRLGARLADTIRALPDRFDEVALVGHSQGGLICRRAWQGLQQTGGGPPIRRVVTVGTPHRGSWEPAAAFSGAIDYVPLLVTVATTVLLPNSPHLVPATVSLLLQILATWPSMYELLPVAPSNPHVKPWPDELYAARSWPAAWGIQQRWLDWSRGPFRDWMLDPASIPPYEVLTTVAGDGRPTPLGWKALDEIGDPKLLRDDGAGDGVVLLTSALLPSAAQYVVNGSHQSLPEQLATSGQLAELVLADRGPVPPPPGPPLSLPGSGWPLMSGPPLAITGVPGVDP